MDWGGEAGYVAGVTLKRKSVVITGAARGIGAATARELVRRGAQVTLLDLDADALAVLAAELGEPHLALTVDVTDSTDLELAFRAASEKFGGVDLVLANAGIASWGSVLTTDPEAFARTVDVNLVGMFRTMHAALPHLIASSGYALLVCSVASFVPMAGGSAYGASKSGGEAFANALRLEVAQHGVGIGSAHMMVVDTDMVSDAVADSPVFAAAMKMIPWPLNRTVPAEECASAFVRAMDRRQRKVFVPSLAKFTDVARWLLNSAPADFLTTTFASKMLAQIEVGGRSLSDRIARLRR